MKVQIRQSVFETNSSSTHALCFVDKKEWNRWRREAEDIFFNMNEGMVYKKDYIKEYEEYEQSCKEKGRNVLSFEDWMCEYKECFTSESEYNYYEHIDTETAEVPGNPELLAVSIYAE